MTNQINVKILHGCYCLHFFQDDAFSVRSTTKWISLPSGSQMCLFVVLIIPSLLTSMIHMLARSAKTPGFTYNMKLGYVLYRILPDSKNKILDTEKYLRVWIFIVKIFIALIPNIIYTGMIWQLSLHVALSTSKHATRSCQGGKQFGFTSWCSPEIIE